MAALPFAMASTGLVVVIAAFLFINVGYPLRPVLGLGGNAGGGYWASTYYDSWRARTRATEATRTTTDTGVRVAKPPPGASEASAKSPRIAKAKKALPAFEQGAPIDGWSRGDSNP
ncbi:hypothetical protein AB0M46_06195 [Dactylosporangium sp. NPDC051485]|uniref:hypothetical protein n=1 Tax=Dactylosporangium sp. NPDC051485 TaxID=3154846 RepID=UPI003425B1E2